MDIDKLKDELERLKIRDIFVSQIHFTKDAWIY